MKLRTWKIKNEDMEEVDSFTETCWYNAQKVFTDRLRRELKGYIRLIDKEEARHYGIAWVGSGMYPIDNGDVLVDDELYDTFFDGNLTTTIRSKIWK